MRTACIELGDQPLPSCGPVLFLVVGNNTDLCLVWKVLLSTMLRWSCLDRPGTPECLCLLNTPKALAIVYLKCDE